MPWSRRAFCLWAGAFFVAGPPAPAGASPATAAMRRLGGLARSVLPTAEIQAILLEPPARPDPVGFAALVRAEFRQGRTVDVGGVRFARIEVARFLRS